MTERPIVIVSNRGPVSFRLDSEGRPEAHRGAGGLTSGLGPLVRDTDTLWIAAALTDGDMAVAGEGVIEAEGFRVRLLAFDAETLAQHYDSVCNEALWFVHHGLFDPVYAPSWPPGWTDVSWAAHRRVNDAFAEAVAAEAPADAVVLIQDYHLCLLAPSLRQQRPDLRLVHFSHTPFATPLLVRMLPDRVRRELLEGLAAHHACGFHTERWAADFRACCDDASISAPATFVSPLGTDADDLEATLASEAASAAAADLDLMVGDRSFLVRVDRLELSKNVLRGFDAYEALLDAHPELHDRVVFGAFLYPSRTGVADYDRYRKAVEQRVEEINSRLGTDSWTPIEYDPHDDYPRSMAALARADVVVVNPIRDGLNLVAKEAMIVNRRHGQLVLSREAGAWDELGDAAWSVDPFDIGSTAEALAAALTASGAERRRRAEVLGALSRGRTPADWLRAKLVAAG